MLVVDQFEMEINRQNDYLVQYGLYRQPIIGDRNCLFRAISNALFGNQDHHLELRLSAVNEIEQNLDHFRMHFHNDNNNLPMNEFEIQRELNQLRQLGTFAGQESILALSRLFNITILLTVGGDVENPNVVTLEHNFHNSESQIHLVWTRGGGGHYETVSENPIIYKSSKQQFQNSTFSKSKFIWKENSCTRQFDLNNVLNSKTRQTDSYIKEHHSYGKREESDIKPANKKQCVHCKKNFF